MSDKGSYDFGMVGLGTMGRNLLLNMADHGVAGAGYDKSAAQVRLLDEAAGETHTKGFSDIRAFAGSLKTPRYIMLLVPAGKIVDSVIEDLLPLLEKGDTLIDGGNSHFTDTNRRIASLEAKGLHFFGMGISGGEEGARNGPSMMPGGDKEAYKAMQPILEAIAAQVEGSPCVAYMGRGSAGHFVKMVHNGIEYAIMQLIADTYEFFKKGLKLDDKEIGEIFTRWDEGRLQSFLLEITRDIFAWKAPGSDHLLLNDIKDEAEANETGKWTSQVAMDLHVPSLTIDTAVSLRHVSGYKALREKMADLYSKEPQGPVPDKDAFAGKAEQAFYFSMIIIYAQGMHLLSKASEAYQYGLNLAEIARIWRGGCIIRSAFLNDIFNAYEKNNALEHLLLDKRVAGALTACIPDTREMINRAVAAGISLPAFNASLSYFDALRSKQMPANLIQAQRDYFGAHTYELVGKEGVFHTQWKKAAPPGGPDFPEA